MKRHGCIPGREVPAVNPVTGVAGHGKPDGFRLDARDPRTPCDRARKDG